MAFDVIDFFAGNPRVQAPQPANKLLKRLDNLRFDGVRFRPIYRYSCGVALRRIFAGDGRRRCLCASARRISLGGHFVVGVFAHCKADAE
jgi:hypothetical protein